MNKELLAALKRVKKQAERHREGKRTQEWFNSACGICGHLDEISQRFENTPLLPYFEEWSRYSGDPKYPVPSLPQFTGSTSSAYFLSDDKWRGEYGDLRMDLLNHCIKTLEKEITL